MCAPYCHLGACHQLWSCRGLARGWGGATRQFRLSDPHFCPAFAHFHCLPPLVPLPFTHPLSQIPVTAGLALGSPFASWPPHHTMLGSQGLHLADTWKLALHSRCSFLTWAGSCSYCRLWVFFLTAGAALSYSCSTFIAVIWRIPSFYLFILLYRVNIYGYIPKSRILIGVSHVNFFNGSFSFNF